MPSDLPDLQLRRAQNLLEMLRNDMRSVVEARCGEHGSKHGTTPNMVIALLPLIGVEMVAQFSTDASVEHKNDAIRRVFAEVALFSGVAAYSTLGYFLFFAYRHGIAHGFYPGQLELNGVTIETTPVAYVDASDLRTTPCIDTLPRASLPPHLVAETRGAKRILHISAQALFLDLDPFLMDFYQRLGTDAALQARVRMNVARLEAEASDTAQKRLKPADLAALNIP